MTEEFNQDDICISVGGGIRKIEGFIPKDKDTSILSFKSINTCMQPDDRLDIIIDDLREIKDRLIRIENIVIKPSADELNSPKGTYTYSTYRLDRKGNKVNVRTFGGE